MSEVLVMGGSRFLGLHTVMALLKNGRAVTILNRDVHPQPAGVKHLRCDRKDYPRLRKLLRLEKFDAVIDITTYEPQDSKPMIEAFDGRIERFVHCSSGAVYEDRWEFPVYEHDPLVPPTEKGGYSENKAECERILFQAFSKTGFPCIVLRPTVIYGPHNYVYREGYVFDRAKAGKPIPVPGDGKSLTHVVHVDDVAGAMVAALGPHNHAGEAYNIAGPRAVTLERWVEAAARPITDHPRIVLDHGNVSRSAATAEPFPLPASPWVMSIEKAKRDLGFDPRDLFTGMKETYEWYSRSRPFDKSDVLPSHSH